MSFITIAGQNSFAAHQAAGTQVSINKFVVANIAGLGAEPVDRIASLPSIGDIVYEQAIPLDHIGYNNANVVTYSLVMPSTLGDFDYNWIGLVSSENILIAAEYLPAVLRKWQTVGFDSGNTKSHHMLIEYSGAQSLLGIDSPAQTWQLDFSDHEGLTGLLGGDVNGHYHVTAPDLPKIQSPFFLSKQIIDTNYTIPAGYNAGGIDTKIANGATVTIPDNTIFKVL